VAELLGDRQPVDVSAGAREEIDRILAAEAGRTAEDESDYLPRINVRD